MSNDITITIKLPASQIASLAQSVALGHYPSLDIAIRHAIEKSQNQDADSMIAQAHKILSSAPDLDKPSGTATSGPASDNQGFFDEWEAELLAMQTGKKP